MKPLFLCFFFLHAILINAQVSDSAKVSIEVDSLISYSIELSDKGDFEKALEVINSAERITFDKFGYNSVVHGNCLYNLAQINFKQGKYLEAEEKFHHSLGIIRNILGGDNLQYAKCLIGLASFYIKIGKFEKSDSIFLQALPIMEKKIGKQSPDYLTSLNNLSILYTDLGKYDKAKSLVLEIKSIQENIIGKIDFDYARTLGNLAHICWKQGEFDDSEKYYLKSKEIAEDVLGTAHPFYAKILNNLSVLYGASGNYEKAEPLFIEAKRLRGSLLGREHSDYAESLINLAILYKKMGKYELAEPLYLEAKSIYEKSFGTEHPDYLSTIGALATFYSLIGNYLKSEQLYLEEKRILELTFGKANAEYAFCLNNLANLYLTSGEYYKAEPLFFESLTIKEKTIGKNHPYYIQTLTNIASLYSVLGNFDKSEQYFNNSLEYLDKTFGKQSPDYGSALSNLSTMFFDKGDYKKALQINLEATAILEATLGEQHPHCLETIINQASIYTALRDYEKVKCLYLKISTLYQNLIENSLHYLSESELGNYIKKYSLILQKLSSVSYLTLDSALISITYNNRLYFKGYLLNSKEHLSNLSLADSTLTDQYYRLKGLQRLLSRQYSLPINKRDSFVVSKLEEKANELEKYLNRRLARLGEAMQQVNWQEVQQHLKPDEVGIEYIQFKFHNPKATDSILYAALILRPNLSAPLYIPLFEERQITSLFKFTSGNAVGKINDIYSWKGENSLQNLIWKPIEPYLDGIKTIYCSPSGLLHRINLAAIPVNNHENINDKYHVVVVGSTRSLVLPDTSERTDKEAVLFGGIRYDADSMAVVKGNLGIEPKKWSDDLPFHPDSLTRGENWKYLPGSIAEVMDIQNLLQSSEWNTRLDTGYNATEERFRKVGDGNAKSPKIIHISTHGFFYPDPRETSSNQNGFSNNEPVFKVSEHPMIRSGLLLAGSNETWSGEKKPENQEDGVLTAYEISQMNLSNTELVVLSACQTGLGEIEGNEGVYGLQRAFKIAGVKYLIMSLWQVNDKATKELITDFYRQWLFYKHEIPEAFRIAQQNLKTKYIKQPYLWAGFVLIQ